MMLASSYGLSACSSAALQSEGKEKKDVLQALVLTRQDDGRSVVVRPGDTITISLPENPSTGYRWSLEQSGEGVVEAVGSRYVHAPAGGVGGVGQGGERMWTFTAVREGTARLSFTLRRPWEGDASAADRFGINILSYR